MNKFSFAPVLLVALLVAAAPRLAGAGELDKLSVMGEDCPRVFFFRNSEGWAANPRIAYERWEGEFERLMGIMGKALDEEVIGREKRNPEFFTRFKQRHPKQAVLLHYNGNARDPRYRAGEFFAGHWVYRPAAEILRDVPAAAGETDIYVGDTKHFNTGIGRYKTSNDDVGLCVRGADGKLDWRQSEQVQLISVDAERGAISVKRGCYGTAPRAFAKGHAIAAAHVTEGPWGATNNLMWYYNYSTTCPRDAKGRTCADVNAADLAGRFGAGGDLAAFDGLEFDVLHFQLGGGGATADCDADGQGDGGVFDGVNQYGVGVTEFLRQLRRRMGDDKLIMADGHAENHQRAPGILNGIESEGWPDLRDHEIADWSGGLNRHFFWAQNGRAPAFSYINHKFTGPGEQPGQRVQPAVPFSTHRLVFAAGVFTDSAICYAFAPPKQGDELIGVWDELWRGTDRKLGWLGKPLGPPLRLAEREKNLIVAAGAPAAAGLARRIAGLGIKVVSDNDALKITGAANAKALEFHLRGAPCAGPDLFVALTARGATQQGYPPETPRLMWVGVTSAEATLTRAGAVETSMRRRGEPEKALDRATGAHVSWSPRVTLAGESHGCLQTHPPYRGGKTGYVAWLRDVDAPENARLEFYLGMGPKAPGRSDGVVFQVLAAKTSDGRRGSFEKIFEHKQVAAKWTRHSVPLAGLAGQTVTLKFVSDCGPKDHSTTDQASWGDVRLLSGPAGAETPEAQFMTWAPKRPFQSGFYFNDVRTPTVNLTFRVEGAEPVWIEKLSLHAHPDAMAREFERGLVLANPGPRPYTFDLAKLFPGRKFRRLQGTARQDPKTNNGAPTGATLTLPPKDALFLVRSN